MEHFRALATFVEPPAREQPRIALALGLDAPPPSEHSDLFLFNLYPYASVYLGAEGMMGGEARDRIAGFWRALELVPPAEPDHLAVMLAFHARLGELEEESAEPLRSAWRRARHAHLWEHLMSWLPAWLHSLETIAPPSYRAWGRMLGSALAEEAAIMGPAVALPRHLEEAPPLADPRVEGVERFVAALLAPARSGMVLTRADLARAAAELHLGLRAGERRYALRHLMAQNTAATLDWLHREAVSWRERHGPTHTVGEIVTAHWTSRAGRTADLLHELEIDTVEVMDVARAGD